MVFCKLNPFKPTCTILFFPCVLIFFCYISNPPKPTHTLQGICTLNFIFSIVNLTILNFNCHVQLQIPLVTLDKSYKFFCHRKHDVAPSRNKNCIKVELAQTFHPTNMPNLCKHPKLKTWVRKPRCYSHYSCIKYVCYLALHVNSI